MPDFNHEVHSINVETLRERIKLSIQTAQDQEGRLLYAIPPGVAGMYADSVMRALTACPHPESTEPVHADGSSRS